MWAGQWCGDSVAERPPIRWRGGHSWAASCYVQVNRSGRPSGRNSLSPLSPLCIDVLSTKIFTFCSKEPNLSSKTLNKLSLEVLLVQNIIFLQLMFCFFFLFSKYISVKTSFSFSTIFLCLGVCTQAILLKYFKAKVASQHFSPRLLHS